ncbi:MAG TPA: DUF4375 domain-containing protein [Chitinophagaceae bacterium]|nr:DUF4375 domain-containing protein [Chitinophagaceae bacterium]
MHKYDIFETENHLQPAFDANVFNSLHRWKFGWEVLSVINVAKDKVHEIELAKRFSPGQKALYFIWYLDAQVTNGGFIQFYWNGYRQYIYPIAAGLKFIGDTETYDILLKADKEYILHKEEFAFQHDRDDWKPLYKNLINFKEYDSAYYRQHDNMMDLIEKYARQNPGDFVKLY